MTVRVVSLRLALDDWLTLAKFFIFLRSQFHREISHTKILYLKTSAAEELNQEQQSTTLDGS